MKRTSDRRFFFSHAGRSVFMVFCGEPNRNEASARPRESGDPELHGTTRPASAGMIPDSGDQFRVMDFGH
ncbi:hypothetical protein, partial [Rhodovulum sp. PH10]|uniref:hypothetical protein n=1 Tax=Rhodovulum sp. PH10 TaxID=1187851 RepID=UPI001ED90843